MKLQGSFTRFFPTSSPSETNNFPHGNLSFSAKSVEPNPVNASKLELNSPSTSVAKDSPLSGLEDVMMGYIFGKKKATEVAHSCKLDRYIRERANSTFVIDAFMNNALANLEYGVVWRHIVQKGDTLVDATCGNGHDTLAMVKMVADKSCRGHVYAMDIQKVALESTSSLLDVSLNSYEKGLVELSAICHSKMEEVVPKGVPVRLVAFNLGYLPCGDKATITKSETTLQALEAAKRILTPGGLISLVVYVGHPGGREEYEAVQAFASGLPVENWICCKLQMLNRSSAPILVLLLKR
ncbi:hypothetical protein Vadar_004046 [Vaccinium darrowii]|uniref:Uncharacterized protein n=1 Tax=Vaccinium darrowii TaxID=229202 RepID=A0ACB7Z1W5_9ERIC|nr:hypothetical protein Vadar_004046 [Vaccinium darrowii]